MRQRIRPDLDMDGDRQRSLAAFLQPWRPVAFRRPQAFAFPAGFGIVDARIEPLGIEAHRIRDAQRYHLAVDERGEAIAFVSGRNRHVLAEPDRVVLVDPAVVARFRTVIANAVKARTRVFVKCPAFRTVVAGRLRSVERCLTLRSVETAEMAAGERHPNHAFGVDVAAARAEARHRYVIDFRELGLRIEAGDTAFAAEHVDGVPDRAVGRVWHDGIGARTADHHVLVRGLRFRGLGVVVDLAVDFGVEYERRPALRLFGVAGF